MFPRGLLFHTGWGWTGESHWGGQQARKEERSSQLAFAWPELEGWGLEQGLVASEALSPATLDGVFGRTRLGP